LSCEAGLEAVNFNLLGCLAYPERRRSVVAFGSQIERVGADVDVGLRRDGKGGGRGIKSDEGGK